MAFLLVRPEAAVSAVMGGLGDKKRLMSGGRHGVEAVRNEMSSSGAFF